MKPWSEIKSAGGDPAECTCRCGAMYHAWAQINMELKRSVSETPCPGCGKSDNLFRVKYPPEQYTIRGDGK